MSFGVDYCTSAVPDSDDFGNPCGGLSANVPGLNVPDAASYSNTAHPRPHRRCGECPGAVHLAVARIDDVAALVPQCALPVIQKLIDRSGCLPQRFAGIWNQLL